MRRRRDCRNAPRRGWGRGRRKSRLSRRPDDMLVAALLDTNRVAPSSLRRMAYLLRTAAAFLPAIIAVLVMMAAHPKTFASLVTLRRLDRRDRCREFLDPAG